MTGLVNKLGEIKPIYWYCLAVVISLSLWGMVILLFDTLYRYLYP